MATVQNNTPSSSMSKPLRPQNLKLALRADSGLSVGQVYALQGPRNIIGRSVEAGIPVDDSKVSRNHAAIDLQNGFHMLVDLGSTNGTYLNGRLVEQSVFLNPGDEIRVGSAVFVVELLEKARYLAGKSWRERTSVMNSALVAKSAGVSASAAVIPSETLERAQKAQRAREISAPHLTFSAITRGLPKSRLSEKQVIYGRWVVAILGLALTVGAIFTRMG